MTEFRTSLVKDATIRDITPDLDFAVVSGASSTTYQPFTAQSPSNSQLVFSIQVPSENIVLGRDVLLQTGLTFRVNVSNVPAGEYAFQYGLTDSLQAFPLASLITTATAQINNTTCSINLQDVLPQLVRLNDTRHLSKYNGMTPSLPDTNFGQYADGVGSNSNPLSAFNNGDFDNSIVPRGSFPVSVTIQHYIAGVLTNASPVSTALGDSWVITISAIVCEPFFLSPFTWGEMSRNAQGLLGINNMTITLNIDQSLKRLMSTSAPAGYNYSLTAGSATNNGSLFTAGAVGISENLTTPRMLFKFLSVQPSDLLNTKNVVPYTDFPRFITASANTQNVPTKQTKTIQTSNLQLNQIPSKFVVVVRKPMNQQTPRDANAFLTITGISINLNNSSGLLSSASQFDLYRLSKRNSGGSQSWSEFSGQAWNNKVVAGVVNGSNVPTIGSILVLDPALDLSLPDWLSNGSLGNFNLQMSLTVSNQFDSDIQPEVVIMCVNDGLLTTTQGVSSVYTGVLTREMVMSAKALPAMSSAEENEQVGGRMLARRGGVMSGAGAGMGRRGRLSGMY